MDDFQISDGATVAALLSKALNSLDKASAIIEQKDQRIKELEASHGGKMDKRSDKAPRRTSRKGNKDGAHQEGGDALPQ